MAEKYGYARVSTYGQDLESQIKALKNEGVPVANIEHEHFTGTKMDRPKFKKLIKRLKSGDTLYVTKLDRFARSTADGVKTIKELFDRGVKVYVLNMGLIEDTPVGRLMINILISFAEFERDLIVERTQTGKALAKEKNPSFREGAKRKYTRAQMEHCLYLYSQDNSFRQIEELTGVNWQAIAREVRNRKAKEGYNVDFVRFAEE